MALSSFETFIIIIAIAAGAILTRFIPFLIFPENQKPPKVISYLGKVLPPAMMGLLVVYCLRQVSITSSSHGIPELLAIITIVILHTYRRNVLLSIGAGTAVYMIFIQLIF